MNPITHQPQTPYPPQQNYHNSSYYPYPEPNKTFRLNPLVLTSLKTVDVDNLQQIFGKGIQDNRDAISSEKITNQKIYDENSDIKAIRDAIASAKLNKERCMQIQENQTRRLQNLIKDTEADDQILHQLEAERKRAAEEEEKKHRDRVIAKKMLQDQMKEKEKLKEEGRKEYEKDMRDVNAIMDRIRQEDLAAKAEDERKKNIARSYMENAYAEKAERKLREKEDEELRKEKERKYFEEVEQREAEQQAKKNAIQFEKDKIFDQLATQAAQKQAEDEYWEKVRNDLYIEQENRKAKIAELEEKAKRQRQKEEMLASAIQQMKEKEQRKKDEAAEEAMFKQKLLEQYKNDEKLELDNLAKRKQKEKEFYAEVERLWKLKIDQYEAQKAQALKELEDAKKEEEAKRILIEKEKERLIRENEDLLKKYYAKGYNEVVNLLKPVNGDSTFKRTNYEPIYNNIFGNMNPNPASAYPKYGKIKNFVYDIDVQDIQENLNMDNYPMYNATLNNDYDSYPSESDYRDMMRRNKMTKMEYAGGPAYRERSYVKGAPNMPEGMEKISIPYLENEYKEKNKNQRIGLKTPIQRPIQREKVMNQQPVTASANFINQVQGNKMNYHIQQQEGQMQRPQTSIPKSQPAIQRAKSAMYRTPTQIQSQNQMPIQQNYYQQNQIQMNENQIPNSQNQIPISQNQIPYNQQNQIPISQNQIPYNQQNQIPYNQQNQMQQNNMQIPQNYNMQVNKPNYNLYEMQNQNNEQQSRTTFNNFIYPSQIQQQQPKRYQYQYLDNNSFYNTGNNNFNQTNMAVNNSNIYARQAEMI